MSDNIRRIVCINLGTRYVGLAAFQDHSLRDWCVRTFNGRWSKAKEKKIRRALGGYLDAYQADLVILKEHDPTRSSPALKHLVETVADLIEERGLPTRRYSLDHLKASLPGGSVMNRKTLAEAVVRRHPAIGREFQIEQKSRNSYYQRMFEAVALGSIYLSG
jgi:hypothetical protein